jgi:hypothetical protein
VTEHALTEFGVAQPDGTVRYPPVQGTL